MKLRTIIGVGITLVLVSSAIYASYTSCSGFLSLKLNEQGDFLAGYIAPLALVWLVVGYLQQGEELEENTKALVSQKMEFEEQNKSIKKQLFENTFFNLLNLHDDITKSIKFEIQNEVLEGRQAIIRILLIFIVNLHKLENPYYRIDEEANMEEGYEKIEHPKDIYNFSNSSDSNLVAEQYLLFYEEFQSYIGHYFRNLYLILKYIDKSELKTQEDKKFYTNLLRAQLSSDELLFLFYNCMSKVGMKKLKPLVEKYEFLEHLPKYKCLSEVKNSFDIKAFGKSSKWKSD